MLFSQGFDLGKCDFGLGKKRYILKLGMVLFIGTIYIRMKKKTLVLKLVMIILHLTNNICTAHMGVVQWLDSLALALTGLLQKVEI